MQSPIDVILFLVLSFINIKKNTKEAQRVSLSLERALFARKTAKGTFAVFQPCEQAALKPLVRTIFSHNAAQNLGVDHSQLGACSKAACLLQIRPLPFAFPCYICTISFIQIASL